MPQSDRTEEPRSTAGATEAADVSVRVFTHARIDVPRDFCGGSPLYSNQGEVSVPICFWLISAQESRGRRVHRLVDCGVPSGPRPGGAPEPLDWQSPARVLADAGVARDDISQLILTHLHRDHCGNLGDFPDVPIVLQREELEGWEETLALPDDFRPLGEGSWIRRSIEPDAIRWLRREAGGGVDLVDGDVTIAPGIDAHLSRRGHSFGLQWISVQTPEGPLAIAGDAAMWYSNLEQMWPSAYCHGSLYEVVKTYAEIVRAVGGELGRVIVGHDPGLFERFPTKTTTHGRVAEVRVASWDDAVAG
jgi:N-acyl homoserine lactone hydrolase